MPPLSLPLVVSTLRSAGCVFAEDEAELILATARTPDEATAMIARRVTGLPLEQVLGWAEFRGMRVAVEPGVFVPRRRTEFLVEQALALGSAASLIVDLCCGSGAVGAALAEALGALGTPGNAPELHAADIDPAAVRCARRNIAVYGGRAHEGDLFEALPDELRERVGILAANVPYVPTGDVALLPSEARDHEPRVALDGGLDGLDVLRRVTAEASGWLAPGGLLLVETSERQVAAAREAFLRGGLDVRLAVSAELGANVLIGTRPHGTRLTPR
ncbi:putative protein N(5)-glutamine methyltransferase [Streptomyces sp. NPDC047022]|uniref:putative protein N(5)-glutamine methyltransferase n=1 Tax=Streptomyces sp. NPDC047022 TaxID=3155737 RepID=UPI0033F8A6DD